MRTNKYRLFSISISIYVKYYHLSYHKFSRKRKKKKEKNFNKARHHIYSPTEKPFVCIRLSAIICYLRACADYISSSRSAQFLPRPPLKMVPAQSAAPQQIGLALLLHPCLYLSFLFTLVEPRSILSTDRIEHRAFSGFAVAHRPRSPLVARLRICCSWTRFVAAPLAFSRWPRFAFEVKSEYRNVKLNRGRIGKNWEFLGIFQIYYRIMFIIQSLDSFFMRLTCFMCTKITKIQIEKKNLLLCG